MRLYAGTTGNFVADATRNNIARRLESAFVEHFRHRPSAAEVRSWEESLARLGLVVTSAKLMDHGTDDGGQGNILVRLRPESLLEGYQPIEISSDEDRVRVLAELLRVL